MEFEGAKHEMRRLSEEIELLNSQVEELSKLKKIAETQMEEALQALQVMQRVMGSLVTNIGNFTAKFYENWNQIILLSLKYTFYDYLTENELKFTIMTEKTAWYSFSWFFIRKSWRLFKILEPCCPVGTHKSWSIF